MFDQIYKRFFIKKAAENSYIKLSLFIKAQIPGLWSWGLVQVSSVRRNKYSDLCVSSCKIWIESPRNFLKQNFIKECWRTGRRTNKIRPAMITTGILSFCSIFFFVVTLFDFWSTCPVKWWCRKASLDFSIRSQSPSTCSFLDYEIQFFTICWKNRSLYALPLPVSRQGWISKYSSIRRWWGWTKICLVVNLLHNISSATFPRMSLGQLVWMHGICKSMAGLESDHLLSGNILINPFVIRYTNVRNSHFKDLIPTQTRTCESAECHRFSEIFQPVKTCRGFKDGTFQRNQSLSAQLSWWVYWPEVKGKKVFEKEHSKKIRTMRVLHRSLGDTG